MGLRRRLLLVVVALFVLLSFAVTFASVVTMRPVLTQRIDQQVQDIASRYAGEAARALASGGTIDVDPRGTPSGTFFVITSSSDVLANLLLSDDGGDDTVTPGDLRQLQHADIAQLSTVDFDDMGGYRAIAMPLDAAGSMQLYVGVPLKEVNQILGALTFVIGISALAAALIVTAVGDAVIRRALRPLFNVIATTERISQLPLDSGEVQLSNRVRIESPDTEVGRVAQSVNRMLNHIESSLEARAASERKVRQFVADASHELRTPLAAVKGYAEITRRHEASLSDEAQLSLTRIEGAADRMSALVNDLLLLARLDEGRELELRDVDLSMLVVEGAADAQAAGGTHPLELDLPDEPVVVTGDLLRLQQVIGNLLTNARVHTPEGTNVHLGLALDGRYALVTVADDGPGIEPELQTRLFERFARGDASRSRSAGSSGLGLAIVRALVQAHDGEIEVESRPGRTVFSVRIPLADASTAAGGAQAVSRP